LGYSGQGFSLKGEKDRFVLPPQFRKDVIAASDGAKVLCLAKHDRWKCLTGFGTARTQGFDAQLDREEELASRRGQDFDRDMRSGQLWTFTTVPFDDSGRFVIPDKLIGVGNVDGQLYFRGGSPFFTIWNPEEIAKMGEGWEADQAACEIMIRDSLAVKSNGKASAKGRKS
jgi:MraZ protein